MGYVVLWFGPVIFRLIYWWLILGPKKWKEKERLQSWIYDYYAESRGMSPPEYGEWYTYHMVIFSFVVVLLGPFNLLGLVMEVSESKEVLKRTISCLSNGR